MKIVTLLFVFLLGITLNACSDSKDRQAELNGNHVWKAQTDALKKAQEAGKLANDVAEKQRKALEKFNQE